jgi:hypothetical protein
MNPDDTDTRRVLTRAAMGIGDGLPLQASEGGIEELRRDIQRLMDMEAIRQLKYAYFRCLDTANLEELATLFHDEVEVHLRGGNYEWRLTGKQAYLDNVRGAFNRQSVGHHNGHHPEIQMLSPTEATGIWYLADNMWTLNHSFHTAGTALYWDRYVKSDERWLIRETRYERIYETSSVLKESLQLSSHYLGVHGPDANA